MSESITNSYIYDTIFLVCLDVPLLPLKAGYEVGQ